MESYQFTPANAGQPEEIRVKLPFEDEQNKEEIFRILEKLKTNEGSVNDSDITLFCRLLSSRTSLKYVHDEALTAQSIYALYDIWRNKQDQLTLRIKVKITNILCKLCNKTKNVPIFDHDKSGGNKKFDWKYAFSLMISVVKNTNKENSGSNAVQYAYNIKELLHKMRRFINDGADSDEIVVESMRLMGDLTYIENFEGIVLLLNCLPTSYQHYDEWMTTWITKWQSINHNPTWDLAWLTLFTRARKYTKKFDWNSLKDFLFTKCRQLMQLPSSGSTISHKNQFPFSVGCYDALLAAPYSNRKFGLNKIAKLLYYISIKYDSKAVNSSVFIDASPITSTPIKLGNSGETVMIPGYNSDAKILSNAHDLAMFYQSIRPFFYPSNNGNWTELLAYFLCTMVSETSRHIGRSLSFAQTKVSISRYEIFELPFHLPTIRYLNGTFTLLTMEGLYSKNVMMQRFCAGSLKNIMTIDPLVCKVVIPFLLNALDTNAVSNQPHQAPSAFYALSVCIKPLLYPTPYLLEYIPDLLRLSLLGGLDSNNQMKTSLCLSMFSTLFGFLPVQSQYSEYTLPTDTMPYLLRANADSNYSDGSFIAALNAYNSSTFNIHLDLIASSFNTFLPALLDKIFQLLECQDPKKGHNSNEDTPDGHEQPKNSFIVGGYIAECVGFIMQGMKPSDPLHAVFEDKIVAYFLNNSPINASKTCAKIMEAITNTNPALVKSLIPKVLENIDGFSSDKLSFRLRLAAGIVRSCLGNTIVNDHIYSNWLSLYTSKAYLNHTDKTVRKHAVKLLKDTLKGLSSFYVHGIKPTYSTLIGGANDVSHGKNIQWHVPSKESLELTSTILNSTVIDAIQEITAAIETYTAVGAAPGSLTTKKIEEIINNGLCIITKALRGAAEVLGDDVVGTIDESWNTYQLPLTVEQDGSADSSHLIPYTGRELVDTKQYPSLSILRTIRYTVFRFLLVLHQQLESSLVDLKDNSTVRKQWLKLYNVLLGRRMSAHKNCDKKKTYLSAMKKTYSSMLVRTVHSCISALVRDKKLSNNESNHMISKSYWSGHDVSTNNIAATATLQFAARIKQFASSIINFMRRSSDTSHRTYTNMYLYSLGSYIQHFYHEYEAVRKAANKLISGMTYFSRYHRTEIIKAQLTILSSPTDGSTAAVGVVTGALLILGYSSSMTRITDDNMLMIRFLRAIVDATSVMTITINEVDKRELIVKKIADLFIKYVEKWQHNPLTDSDVTAILELFERITKPNEAVSAAVGLRAESFVSFIVLHLISHRDVSSRIPPEMWVWIVNNVVSNSGPPQQINTTTFTKLCYLVDRKVIPAPLNHVNLLAPSMYKSLLQGVALSHPHDNSNEDGNVAAQWSRGIGHVLRCANQMAGKIEPSLIRIRSSSSVCSSAFKRHHMLLFSTLPKVLGYFQQAVDGFESPLLDFVTNMLQASKQLADTSEEEARSGNITRAELFGGFYRGLVNADTFTTDGTWRGKVESLLISFLEENMEKISKDFALDWAEAVKDACIYVSPAAAQQDGPVLHSKLHQYVFGGYQKTLKSNDSMEISGEVVVEDGFAKYEKLLLLTKAYLWADIAVSMVLQRPSSVGYTLLHYTCSECNHLVSPYRSTRVETAAILGLLSEIYVASDANSSALLESSLHTIFTSLAGTVKSSDSAAVDDITAKKIYNASELALFWLNYIMQGTNQCKVWTVLVHNLLELALLVSGNKDPELSKKAVETCLFFAHNYNVVDASKESKDVSMLIELLVKNSVSSSWHIQDTALKSLTIIMSKNWAMMTNDHKKKLKDAYNTGLADSNPAIIELSTTGMAWYLSLKTAKELTTLSSAFIKNCDILANRERDRKKMKVAVNESSKADKAYVNAIQMCCCVVLSMPLDLPVYMPSMIASILQHLYINSNAVVQELVMKTIQSFKMSHQDRWFEYKNSFSPELLQELKGAGAQSYYT